MNEEYDWTRLVEPTPAELAKLDRLVVDTDRPLIGTLQLVVGHEPEDRTPYLVELARDARIGLGVLIANFKGGNSLFPKLPSETYVRLRDMAVREVMPPCSNIDVYKEISSEIKGIMQRMMADDKKQKATFKRLRPIKTAVEKRTARELDLKKAVDIMTHGTDHGEFYLPGIAPQNSYTSRPARSRRHSRREHIPQSEQLGTILQEADRARFTPLTRG